MTVRLFYFEPTYNSFQRIRIKADGFYADLAAKLFAEFCDCRLLDIRRQNEKADYSEKN